MRCYAAELSVRSLDMIRICPNPTEWHRVYERLLSFAHKNNCIAPPRPLILSGWWYTNDTEKQNRWSDTVAWANNNRCSELTDLPDDAFYSVVEPSTYTIGPMGGPMFREWDYEEKPVQEQRQLDEMLERLLTDWAETIGGELGACTRPIAFSGAKSRRLIVAYAPGTVPPWGDWTCLSSIESKRRTFTAFRTVVNAILAPHEVDHIDFTPECRDEQSHAPEPAAGPVSNGDSSPPAR